MLAALLACYHIQYLESKVTIVVKECCRQVVARCLCDHARLRGYQQFDLYIEECSMGHLIGSFNWTFAMVSSLTQTHWGLWSGFLWLSSFKNLTHTISSSQLLCSCMCLFSNHLHGSFFVACTATRFLCSCINLVAQIGISRMHINSVLAVFLFLFLSTADFIIITHVNASALNAACTIRSHGLYLAIPNVYDSSSVFV